MTIDLPLYFYQQFKFKYILLDTTVFIDAFAHPEEFIIFFNKLREQQAIFVTIPPVRIEFLKGNPDPVSFVKKENFIKTIVETDLPIDQNDFDLILRLIKLLGEDNRTASITDLMLGALLMKYPEKLFLFTRNTTDFPTDVFRLVSHFDLLHRKTILSYGVYSFPN